MQNKKTSSKQAALHIEQGISKLTVKMPFNHPTSSEGDSSKEKVMQDKNTEVKKPKREKKDKSDKKAKTEKKEKKKKKKR